ncbi:thioesterase family protein [Nocardia sp. CDC153]|uniref:thioesterase family protein n=1 Tax=Nocardia sp. CDC153 TaxID=3112167 RepID=UPI002DB8C986|nr:thioesterase family protein [Nocardia sp. CDC153]MEC3957021.1 thioesterase family protein [Nocardia sp. CDC153]
MTRVDMTAAHEPATAEAAELPAYYVSRGPGADGYERYAASESTVSVWAASMQHGAPPSALLARAVERCAPREGTRVARFTMEILGPVPVGEIGVRAWVERPGKRVELVAAELIAPQPDGSGRVVAKASAWRIATSDSSSVTHYADPALPALPESAEIGWGVPDGWDVGYVRSVEIRAVESDAITRRVWVRPLVDVVEGEHISPLVRVFSVADVANGVGAQLDPSQWTFLNTDLTIDLYRLPVGEWIGLAVETTIGPDGVGLCSTVLHDEQGPIGRGMQILEVRARA